MKSGLNASKNGINLKVYRHPKPLIRSTTSASRYQPWFCAEPLTSLNYFHLWFIGFQLKWFLGIFYEILSPDQPLFLSKVWVIQFHFLRLKTSQWFAYSLRLVFGCFIQRCSVNLLTKTSIYGIALIWQHFVLSPPSQILE